MKKIEYNIYQTSCNPINEPQFIREAFLKGGLNKAERELLDILKHPCFQPDESLHWKARCLKSYENARYLMKVYPLTVEDIQNQSDRFYALQEWITLIDGTLTTILSIHYNLCLGTLLASPKTAHKHWKTIHDLLTGKYIGVFLATELGYGNNVMSLQTEARYNPKTRSFCIRSASHEARKFMPNTGAAGIAKQAIVFARLLVDENDYGVFPFLVPIHDESGAVRSGIEITPLGEKPGYELDNAITCFHGVEVPFENLILDDQTDFAEDGTLTSKIISRRQRFLESIDRVNMGKIVLSSGISRGMSLCLRISSDYLSNRKTFAPKQEDIPIIKYSHIENYLSHSLAKTFACKSLYDSCRDLVDSSYGKNSIQTTRALAILKIVTTQLAHEVLFQTREKIGAQGLFSKNRVASFLCQLPGIVTAEGDNDILLIRLAREMLLGQGYQLPKIRWMSLTLARLQRKPDWKNILAATELKMILAIRIKTFWNIKILKKSLFQSWNETLPRAMDVSRIHAYRVCLESLNLRARRCHPHIQSLSHSIEEIFTQSVIEKFLPQILENVTVTSGQMRALKKDSVRHVRKIIVHKSSLLTSLDVPAYLISSPLLGDYVDNYIRKTP